MSQKIIIDPVTRIEGHAKITIHLDATGQVEDARFHVTEFRGFEKFCEGRPLWEMSGITGRICGICPVSHLLASAKVCDRLDKNGLIKKVNLMITTGQNNLAMNRTVAQIARSQRKHKAHHTAKLGFLSHNFLTLLLNANGDGET